SDMWSSIAVLVGLGFVWFGYTWADSVAALIVAVFICVAGRKLGRRTVDMLRIPGVVAINRLRVRQAGHVLFVDLVVAVSRTLPLDRVTVLKERIVDA